MKRILKFVLLFSEYSELKFWLKFKINASML